MDEGQIRRLCVHEAGHILVAYVAAGISGGCYIDWSGGKTSFAQDDARGLTPLKTTMLNLFTSLAGDLAERSCRGGAPLGGMDFDGVDARMAANSLIKAGPAFKMWTPEELLGANKLLVSFWLGTHDRALKRLAKAMWDRSFPIALTAREAREVLWNCDSLKGWRPVLDDGPVLTRWCAEVHEAMDDFASRENTLRFAHVHALLQARLAGSRR